MERVAAHEIKKIVVAHKDRLCRFGFDFVEWFCHLNGCQIEVLNQTYSSPHQELMDDFMAVMHCFSSKLYFLRQRSGKSARIAEKKEIIKKKPQALDKEEKNISNEELKEESN